MAALGLLVLLVCLLNSTTATPIIEDPCNSSTVMLDDGGRRPECKESYGKCDRYILPDWYRLQLNDTAGEYLTMHTSPVPANSCGTRFPIWLNGSHPTEAEGIVERTGCVRNDLNSCEVEYTIKMKNCSEYMVYYLNRAKGCNERYCFEGPSKSGKCSPPTTTTSTTTTTPTTTTTTPTTTTTSTTTTTPKPTTSTTTTTPTTTTYTTTPTTTTTTPTTTSATTPTTTTSATTERPSIGSGKGSAGRPLTGSGAGSAGQLISEDNRKENKVKVEVEDTVGDSGVVIALVVFSVVLLLIIMGLLFYFMVYKKRGRSGDIYKQFNEIPVYNTKPI